jgi:hypothetical protein
MELSAQVTMKSSCCQVIGGADPVSVRCMEYAQARQEKK